jgi:hypothetical protein
MDGWIRRLIILEMDLQLIMPNREISNVSKKERYCRKKNKILLFHSFQIAYIWKVKR